MKIFYPYCILLIIIVCHACSSSGTKSPAADTTQAIAETPIPPDNEADTNIVEEEQFAGSINIDSIISAIDPKYAKKDLKAFVYYYNDTTETVFIEDSIKGITCKLYFLSNLTLVNDTLQPADANNLLPGIKAKKAVLLFNGQNIPWEGGIGDVDMMIPEVLMTFNYNGENCVFLKLDHMSLTTVGSYPAYLLLVLNQQKQITYQVRIDEPLTPALLEEYLSPEYRESDQIVDLFQSKNGDAIAGHCGFPFLLGIGEADDTAGITDDRILKNKLRALFDKHMFDEFFSGEKRVNIHEHTISYEVRDYNEDGEMESESDIIFHFRKNASGKVELYRIALAG